jgi:NAD(P)H dehydrogenase (quinone)
MHAYILYAHPGPRSFSREVLEAFLEGLALGGHSHEIHDLYADAAVTDMDAVQYAREVGGDPAAPLPEDVVREHERIARAEALVFIYPVWWSDCPAKLKGWFDRVWAYGYAYFYEADGLRRSVIRPRKALVICPAGHTEEHLEETGIADAMRRIMLQDRLRNVGFEDVRMEILGGMMPGDPTHRERNLRRARRLGEML